MSKLFLFFGGGGFPTILHKFNKFPTYLRLGMALIKFPTISQIPNQHGNPDLITLQD